MSTAAAPHADAAHGEHHVNYVKIWAILLALLIVSVVGPMLEIRIVTLITAFGVAGVKAYLVVVNFMHLGKEKKYIAYLLGVCIAFMILMFAAVSPDVMKHEGRNWVNPSAKNPAAPAGKVEAHAPAAPAHH